MGELLLGIDLGTTSVKAGIVTPDGQQVATFAETYPTVRGEHGKCEQNPDDWLRLIDAARSSVLSDVAAADIACGGLTSQVNTHVFVDGNGKPLIPAILWQDTRAALEAAELDARLTDAQKTAWFGAPVAIDASHLLARMLWVARHQPEIWERTTHVLLPKDFALRHITGELATDPLSNVRLVGADGGFILELLALVPGAAERVAPLKAPTDIVGRNANGVPFANGTMDGWTGLVGTGACHEGAFAYLSGTSEVLGVASRTGTGEPGVVIFPQSEGVRLHAGPTQSGGASQQWFCDLAGLSIEDMITAVEAHPRRPVTPLFLPQLAGERAPVWNADLRGAFLGLEAGMGTADFARAVYEGVALSGFHLLGALEASAGFQADTILCAGGGFRSAPWGQIRADIFGRPMKRLAIGEAGVVGAACLAAVAAGKAPSLSAAHEPFQRFDHVWTPNQNMRGLYDDLFSIYKDAMAANESIGKRLTSRIRQSNRSSHHDALQNEI